MIGIVETSTPNNIESTMQKKNKRGMMKKVKDISHSISTF
jgi:adenosine/AMP kinase